VGDATTIEEDQLIRVVNILCKNKKAGSKSSTKGPPKVASSSSTTPTTSNSLASAQPPASVRPSIPTTTTPHL